MSLDVHFNATHFAGPLSAAEFIPPPGCIDNDAIESAAGIESTKVVRRLSLHDNQVPGTAVVAKTVLAHIARASGNVIGVDIATSTIATGADRTVNVDLQKSTAGGAFATVLSATAELDNGSTVRTVYSGTISAAPFVAGDIFQIVTTVAGSADNQAQGLQVTITLDENPQ